MKTVLFLMLQIILLQFSFAGTAGDFNTAFGSDGKVAFTPSFNNDQAQKTLVQPDGKILVLATKGETGPAPFIGYITRFNADGSPDQTFGYGSAATYLAASQTEGTLPRYMALAPGGKIVVLGMITAADMDMFVMQLNSDGTFDTTFNSTGLLVLNNVNLTTEVAAGLVVQSDGKIIVANNASDNSTSSLLLSRINPNGTFDLQYAFFGLNILAESGKAYNIVELINDEISGHVVAVGGSKDLSSGVENPIVVAFNNAGLDSTFGTNGITRIASSSTTAFATAAIWKNNTGFAVAFSSPYTGQSFLYHFTPAGAEDASYNTVFPCPGTVVETMAQQSNGLIVYGGHQFVDNYHSLVLVGRLQYYGGVDSTFARKGYVLYSIYGDSIGSVRGLQVLADGSILGATDFDNTTYGTDLIVFELIPDNIADVHFQTYSTGFGNTPVGGYSVQQSLFIHGEWVPNDVTLSTTSDFQLSKDGVNWGQSFTLAPSDFDTTATGNVFFKVRFAPQSLGLKNGIIWSDCSVLIAQANDTVLLNGTGVQPNGIANMYTDVFNVYPNPANNIINVVTDDLDNTLIEVLDVTGRVVEVFNTTGRATTLNISRLTQGIYILKLGSRIARFQKQ